MRGYEAVALEPLNSADNRDMGNAEAMGKINRAGFAGLGDQFCDEFGIILSRFLGMLFASAPPDRRGRRCAGFAWFFSGSAELLHEMKEERRKIVLTTIR